MAPLNRAEFQASTETSSTHRFARQLAGKRQVDVNLFKEAEAAFGRSGVVNMVYLIGIYLFTCEMLNAFAVPAPK